MQIGGKQKMDRQIIISINKFKFIGKYEYLVT